MPLGMRPVWFQNGSHTHGSAGGVALEEVALWPNGASSLEPQRSLWSELSGREGILSEKSPL